jgi:AraC-like DNA-binding protein
LLLLQEFFTIKSRAPTMAAGAALFAVTAFIAYAPTTEYLIHRAGGATVLVVSLYIAAALTLFLMALYRDPRRYWHLVIWTVIILISAANTLYGLALYRFYAISFSFALRLPLLLFAAVLVYLIELKNIKKERDSLTQALLKKSREVQRLSRPPARGETRLISRDIIQDLVEYLDSNYHETYDRAALARRFNLSEDYMGHLFKKATSTNIANYINCRRIEAAKQLLEETDSKVIDIAFHVGFDNLTYFYRHFKKVTGYSPADYRARKRDSLYRFDSVSEEVL